MGGAIRRIKGESDASAQVGVGQRIAEIGGVQFHGLTADGGR